MSRRFWFAPTVRSLALVWLVFACLGGLVGIAAAQSPRIPGGRIVFVVRHQYAGDHHNTATMFQTGEINAAKFRGPGAIKVLDVQSGRVRTLLDVPEGVARDLDVSYDGRRILFSMRRNRGDDYHIYEMNADGTGLVQLTFGRGISDIDPVYLPDGRILFSSTREPKYCMCNRHIMANLFTMDRDGANIQQIGHSTLHEGHAAVMPDGRVLYDRWEYVDRNFGDAQGLWTVNPDGTNHALFWGNNTNSPGAVLEGRIVPGSELVVCTFSSCHDRPWGAIALVDRRLGTDGPGPVLRTWPAGARELVGRGNYDTFKKVWPKYEDPYPLSPRQFLCSRTGIDPPAVAKRPGNADGERTGIYLLDLDGEDRLIYAEPKLGCYDPMPLAARPRPPILPSRTDLRRPEGLFYVANVYAGTGMDRVRPGEVKSIRVVESPEKRYWTRPAYDGGTGQQAPGMAWDDFNNKRILGTAPVEADGSAFFAVPADRFVYFQLLDERGMMVQSMRSGTIVRPGETIGCGGCHESRRGSVAVDYRSLAVRRGPSRLKPWHGPPRLFSYTAEVQPVWDRHCVQCHDYGKPAGRKLNLAGDRGIVFCASYVELRARRWVRVPGAGPYKTLPPKSWGSHASPLVRVLLEGHGDEAIDREVRLDDESFDRVVTWIDINAPYYPTYASAYRDHPYGRSPLDARQLKRLAELTGTEPHGRSTAFSFTRPELSPALEKLADPNDPRRREALELLRLGQRRLERRPRADMPGFQLVAPVEIRQEAKYQARLQIEAAMRKAIASGQHRHESAQPNR